jgi:glycosyltransferase involved in cell wall biosynthesis
VALPPATSLHESNELIIGLAGQIYSVEEWNALIAVLDSVGWKIAGREVKIRLLGRYASLYAKSKMRVEFLGWASQLETIKLMSEADILYCPYWFDPVFESEARLSFPSKLTTYLAAGRPVLFHGPAYASPGRFLQENKAGVCCNSLENGDIINAIESLVSKPDLYTELALNGRIAFDKYLTLTSMKAKFYEFLGISEQGA